MVQKQLELLYSNSKWQNRIAFSLTDIAEMLGMPLSTITKICKDGEMKYFKVGRQYRVSKIELYYFLQSLEDRYYS